MLVRRSTADGLVIFESQLLAALNLPHAFSSRAGGLDLAVGPQSPVAPSGHPYHRLLSAIGVADAQTVWTRQVHGRCVLTVTPDNAHAHTEADGIATAHPNLVLTIRVADCVPVLLAAHAAGRPRAVAAVHAGWRGLVAGILPTAVAAIRHELGDDRFTLAAAIGPCIGRDRFEVGPEVAQAFSDAGLGAAVVQGASEGGKSHVDLQAAAVRQLRDAGLADADIDRSDLCTHRDEADFYSHRRDKGNTGRLAAVIVMRG